MELISRPNYYSKVEKLLGTGILIVLTGQRRVGKSYVMKELVQRKQQEDANLYDAGEGLGKDSPYDISDSHSNAKRSWGVSFAA